MYQLERRETTDSIGIPSFSALLLSIAVYVVRAPRDHTAIRHGVLGIHDEAAVACSRQLSSR